MPTLPATGFFPANSETYTSTLSSSIGAGVATVPVTSASPFTDGDHVVLTVDPGVSGKQATFTGTKSGSSFINCTWTEGNVGVGHDGGAVIADYDSATHFGLVSKGMRVAHNQDGTLKPASVDSAIAAGSIDAAQLADAAVTPAKLLAGTGTSWPWQTYTPTLSNITIGTGGSVENNARYIQTGKTVVAKGRIILGSSGASVGTAPTISLPVAASASITIGLNPIGNVVFADSGVGQYDGRIYLDSSTIASFQTILTGGTFAVLSPVNSTAPFTWGPADGFIWTLIYEAA